MRAGGVFEAGAAIGEEISSRHVSLTMKGAVLGLDTTFRVAAGIGGRNTPTQQADRDHQS
jgi:hypothetical protein